jgi:pimeloyl-ACP methyl ester carboxylesterase
MKHHTIVLKDGRRLTCSELGPETGPAVLYLHGNPGSRLELLRPEHAQAFIAGGLRVLSLDRPGYGGSCQPAMHGHQHIAHDVEQLLDTLKIDACVVVGHSRGSLPALALGAHLPLRVSAIGLLGATGMPDDALLMKDKVAAAKLLLFLVKYAPAVARSMMRLNYFLDAVSPGTRVLRLKAGLPSVFDRRLLEREGRQFAEALHEGLAPNPAWIIEDWRAWLVHPLGFSLADVKCPVYVWMGEDDQTCPVSNAKRLSQRIDTLVEFVTVPQMGHLHTPDVLVSLMQRLCQRKYSRQPDFTVEE